MTTQQLLSELGNLSLKIETGMKNPTKENAASYFSQYKLLCAQFALQANQNELELFAEHYLLLKRNLDQNKIKQACTEMFSRIDRLCISLVQIEED